jgi:hypothetical protein
MEQTVGSLLGDDKVRSFGTSPTAMRNEAPIYVMVDEPSADVLVKA